MASASTRKQSLKPAFSNAKKRKSSDLTDADALSHTSKQPKINAFFTPRVSLSTTCGTDKTTSVANLSEEQCRVLQLVVEEGKSVFFTGSAGARSVLVAVWTVCALADPVRHIDCCCGYRYGKIIALEGDHIGVETQARQ